MRSRIAPLIAAALLGACAAPTATPTVTPAPATATIPSTSLPTPASATATVSPTPPPTPEPTSTLYDLSFLNELPPDAILLQHQRVTCSSMPCSEILAFTLYADGTVIRLIAPEHTPWRVLESQLSRQEVDNFMVNLLALGTERLKGYPYTDVCGHPRIEEAPCITDQVSSFLRVRLDSSGLREIEVYNDYTNDPEAFNAIRRFLADYDDPGAALYEPAYYTLMSGEERRQVQSTAAWPLDASLLIPETWFDGPEIVIDAQQAALLKPYYESNIGEVTFKTHDKKFLVWLTPNLPDGRPIRWVYWLLP